MSTIFFGIAILSLLVIGLYRRKKEEKNWVKEERYEESGDWLDKRAGERGTYGSLDREREAERAEIYHTGRIQELIRDIEKEMDWIPGRHTKLIREKMDDLALLAKNIIAGKTPTAPLDITASGEQADNLKKIILDAFFDLFPSLLNADIQHIKSFDAHVQNKALSLVAMNK
jgi:hypothetical protein